MTAIHNERSLDLTPDEILKASSVKPRKTLSELANALFALPQISWGFLIQNESLGERLNRKTEFRCFIRTPTKYFESTQPTAEAAVRETLSNTGIAVPKGLFE